jgi:hypothetical protein
MAEERVIVFRVSDWFFERINEYCKREGVSYAELFRRAVEYLCRRYLEEGVEDEGACSGEADRVAHRCGVISEA